MTSDAQDYVNEWASRTGRAPSDVYVPVALRDPEEAPSVVVVHSVHKGRKYAIELDVTGPASDLATGRVTGVVRKIEETPSA